MTIRRKEKGERQGNRFLVNVMIVIEENRKLYYGGDYDAFKVNHEQDDDEEA